MANIKFVSPKADIQAEVGGTVCFMGTFSADACKARGKNDAHIQRCMYIFRSRYAGNQILVEAAQPNGWEILGG